MRTFKTETTISSTTTTTTTITSTTTTITNFSQVQQTPNPFAHVPALVPPLLEHSSLKEAKISTKHFN